MEPPRFAAAPAMTIHSLAQQENGATSLDPMSTAITPKELHCASKAPLEPTLPGAEPVQILPKLAPRHPTPPAAPCLNSMAEETVHLRTISENAKMRRRASARTDLSSAAQSPVPESLVSVATNHAYERKGAQQPPKAAKKRTAPSSHLAKSSKSSKRPRPWPVEREAGEEVEHSLPNALSAEYRRPRAKNRDLASEVSKSLTTFASDYNEVQAQAMVPPVSRGERRSARTSSLKTLPLSDTDQPVGTPPPSKDSTLSPVLPTVVFQPPCVPSPVLGNLVFEQISSVGEHVTVPAPVSEPRPVVPSRMVATPEQTKLSLVPVTESMISHDNSLIVDQDDEILLSLKLEKAQAHIKELQFYQEELDIKIHMRQLQLRKSRSNFRSISGTAVASLDTNPLPNAVDAQTAILPEAETPLPDVPIAPFKRSSVSQEYLNLNSISDIRPYQNTKEDSQFVANVKQHLKRYDGKKVSEPNFTHKASARLLPLLEIATVPSSSEALWLTGREAAELVKPGAFFPGPIITEGQQILPLQSPETFLSEYYDDTLLVWIQDQAVKQTEGNHARLESVAAVKARLKSTTTSKKPPWNCLELATHRDDGLRPCFLNNEECSLLTKIKQPGKNDEASRRGFIPGWREVEKWALLAQGGALTEPHQDSHGYSTFITVNHGRVGFGWLSNPSCEERAAWCDEPWSYAGGQWRYVVLHPGQTVYFPTGTAHFVFRLPTDGHTLAFGGHILRCSQIEAWARTILEEQRQPNVTNEDLKIAAITYLERVEKYVKQSMKKNENLDRWGGEAACAEFLRLKNDIVNFRPPDEVDNDESQDQEDATQD
ncbi:Hypothetical protein R9X50_00361900 [Acrodontium crateriforme]|uniref:JmjC domain-containing protein n=1 Tax=Acrodontium crateriforme TaxID=150365 RepID=A0AAQ3M3S6_9PEZI|nr:Hypothetical protein R9X50_00361900 [Acrodontium crateriforme]